MLHVYLVWQRPNYHSSAAVSMAIDGALEISGLAKDDISLYDFYSYVVLKLKVRVANADSEYN